MGRFLPRQSEAEKVAKSKDRIEEMKNVIKALIPAIPYSCSNLK